MAEPGLEATYAIVFFDAIRVKIRNEGMVNNRAVYLAIGVRCSGHKEILGLWIEQTEGAKFWLRVMTELRNRGTQDILIAVVDGLKGFPEAITSVFPQAVVQTCIVHLIRYSMHFAAWKERRPLAAGTQTDLPGRIGRGGAGAAGGFRPRPVGAEISGDRAKLAAQLGAGDSVLRLRPGTQKNPLHHQRHREPQRPGPQGGAGPRPFSQRGGGDQTHLAGAAQGSGALEKSADFVARCQDPDGDPVRRPLRGGGLRMRRCRT